MAGAALARDGELHILLVRLPVTGVRGPFGRHSNKGDPAAVSWCEWFLYVPFLTIQNPEFCLFFFLDMESISATLELGQVRHGESSNNPLMAEIFGPVAGEAGSIYGSIKPLSF